MFRRALLVFTDVELRTKILKILGLLIIIRLLAYIPIPLLGVNDISGLLGGDAVFGLLNVISGGAYQSLAFVMLGVAPYITASIVFQLLGVIIPKLNEIRREEGESGRAKINRWTRYLTVPLAALQAWGILRFLAVAGNTGQGRLLPDVFYQSDLNNETLWAWFVVIVSMVAGSLIMIWLGEIITEYKMGNGISLIILAGIVSQLPSGVVDFWNNSWPSMVEMFNTLSNNISNLEIWKQVLWQNPAWASARSFFIIIFTFITTLTLVIYIGEAMRRLPIIYSRRGQSEGTSRTLGRVQADLPVKVNMAGVIPIIFAISFILFPSVVATFFSTSTIPQIEQAATSVQAFLSSNPNQVLEPENIAPNFLGFYHTDNVDSFLATKAFDTTQGQELFGFSINNLKESCNDNTKNFFFGGTFLNFELPCGGVEFLPKFALYWPGILAYNFFYFFLIIFFTYFYSTNVAFKTEEISEDLQKMGAYIPGVRPGEQTKNYLSYISTRLNVVGSLFLAGIAVLPILLGNNLQMSGGVISGVVGGTTLLILVSVTIESLTQIMAQATSIDYDRFTKRK